MNKLDILEQRCNTQEKLLLEYMEHLKLFSNMKSHNFQYAKQRAKDLIKKLEVYKVTGKDIENAELI